MRLATIFRGAILLAATASAAASDSIATRPDYAYVGSAGATDLLSFSADSTKVYVHYYHRNSITEFETASRSSRTLALPVLPSDTHYDEVVTYSPISNLALFRSYLRSAGPFGAYGFAIADLRGDRLLPVTGPYTVADNFVLGSGKYLDNNFRDLSGRRFPVIVESTPVAGGPTTSFVAVLEADDTAVRVRVCGSPLVTTPSADGMSFTAVGDDTTLVSYDAVPNVVIVATRPFGSTASPRLGTLECNTDDLQRRPTQIALNLEFSATTVAPPAGSAADEYSAWSSDARIAVSKGGYILDRVTRSVLVTPQALGRDPTHDLTYKAMSRDGHYVLMQRQRVGTVNEDASILISDTGTQRVATFVLSRSLQPLVAFGGFDYTFADDGSKVLFKGGGVDFIEVPPNETGAPYITLEACNPFVCDALPVVARASVPIATGTVLSDDGRFAFFDSAQSDLVSGDGNNAVDVFRVDRSTGLLTAVSRDPSGALLVGGGRGPSVNSDGTRVAFDAPASHASNAPTDVVVKNTVSGAVMQIGQLLGVDVATTPLFDATLSGNGKFVAFATRASGLTAGDANGRINVFRVDLDTRATVLASADAHSDCVRPLLSRDGSAVAFDCTSPAAIATDKDSLPELTRTMLLDFLAHKLEVVSHGANGPAETANAASRVLGLSADGTSVLFSSAASNIDANDTNGQTDLFLYRRGSGGAAQRLSVSSTGGVIDGPVTGGALSGDGKAFAFSSTATNIDPLGLGGNNALYLGSTEGGPIRQVRRGTAGALNASTTLAALSYTGSDVVFSSDAGSGGGGPQPKAGTTSLLAANNPSVGTDTLSVGSQYAGLWYNLAQNGHGYLVELTESNGVPTVIVSWYVYQNGAQRWLLGSAPLRAGSITVPMYITRGASFSPHFDPAQVVVEPWGVLTMKFIGPNQGLFAWASSYPGFGSGVLKVDRLSNVSDPKDDLFGEMPSCAGGTWYDPAASGQGFQVEKIAGFPAQLAVIWYAYDQGQQFWLIGAGPISGNQAVVPLVSTRGGRFPPSFNPLAVQQAPWGSITFTFNSENSARVAWTPTAPGFSAGAMNLSRLSLLSARPCR